MKTGMIDKALYYERRRALKYGYNTLYDMEEYKDDMLQDIALALIEDGELDDFDATRKKACCILSRYTRAVIRRNERQFDIEDMFDLPDDDEDANALENLERDIRGLSSYSERQIEIMLWIADGVSQNEIAERQGCSPQAINRAIERIKQKAEKDERLHDILTA